MIRGEGDANEAAPLLDLAKFRVVTMGDPQVEYDILAEFLSATKQDEAALRVAIMHGDAAAVRHHAHRIKGAAWVIAALPLVQTCEAIENAARLNSTEMRNVRLDDFDSVLPGVYAVVESVLATLRSGA